MDREQFAGAMRRRGCVDDGKNFCGVYKGLPFAAAYVRGGKNGATVFSLRIQFSSSPSGNLFGPLKKRLKGTVKLQKLPVAQQVKNRFAVSATTWAGMSPETAFDALLEEMAGIAAAFGLTGGGICPICKQQTPCDAYAYVTDAYVPVHAACVQAKGREVREQIQQNELEGSYASGAVGAVLGGIVGAVPTVVLVVFGGIISGWLCALIPLGAYYGYKLLRGKLNSAALGVIVAVSVLMVPVTQFFVELLWSIKEGYGAFSPADYLVYLAAYPEDLLPGMLQYLLFIAIGFFLVFRLVKTNNAAMWGQSSFSEATLRPMTHTFAPSPEGTHGNTGQ